ncbi:MAG: hypothetical protein A2W59_00820 [Candidatus Terrybacteria bacterium RIFCSPHIGHO2_02_41_19]|uniref:DUF4145 domain-containing protein n=1 Tax=Candidatus Terrybacteria bacterium RIFCSPHIGHO2_02_41_19 TaxID=1802364 RepID=A0A1G2PLS6_9BACT|nr:MAG: hypothetical protein A2W59_00820 [Candidatus Terrybacteria bacterium RIFCSPHIGHO2_02_41_19]
MTKEKYYLPTHATGQFHCPHCGVYAKQRWAHLSAVSDAYTRHYQNGTLSYSSNILGLAITSFNLVEDWTVSICEHCYGMVIWFDKKIIYPKKITVSAPNEDLNKDIQKDYLEAANVFADSPRSSAALLRLALQKLCKQLGEKGDNINDDIKNLVKKGLNPKIQQSLDILRITGNNAVHPGEINLEEEPEKVLKLFELINFITEKMITELKEINNFYDTLPENSKKAVEKRDNK